MKTKLTALILALGTCIATAHEGVELGPNKGRILEFSTDETMHGEVTEKGGKLHIALLDKDMKPVKIAAHTVTATAGTRQAPVKLEVTTADNAYVIPAPKAGEWIILQYKPAADAKAITARLNYDTRKCGPCDQPEWRCACGEEEEKG